MTSADDWFEKQYIFLSFLTKRTWPEMKFWNILKENFNNQITYTKQLEAERGTN